ncbi:MAG TPA: hypothetical protein VL752_21295 [Acidisoma sp.]|jgi:hypothetical protein|uniref:hypothetical protein n=1 Tax=Acidisoma sp. TaxID=1872115 RepID=UPI002C458CFA|nr:hypothetical protein [Acidisoma sp.]HTI03490.1 hypothetical protein [Acidisoma sp.]
MAMVQRQEAREIDFADLEMITLIRRRLGEHESYHLAVILFDHRHLRQAEIEIIGHHFDAGGEGRLYHVPYSLLGAVVDDDALDMKVDRLLCEGAEAVRSC